MKDLKNTISQVVQKFTKTSSKVIKSTKLSFELAQEEEKLKDLYLSIGKKVHEIYAYGGSIGQFFDEQYLEIIKQEKIISTIKNTINNVKGSKTCQKCSSSIEEDATFCNKCGHKIDEFALKQTNVLNNNIVDQNIKKEGQDILCDFCKFKNEYGEKFCNSCGRKLNM